MKRRTISLVAALALAAASCSGGNGSAAGVASLDDANPTEAEAAISETLTQEEAMLAFTQCVRDQGIDMADPTVDENGNVRLARPQATEGEFDRQAFQQVVAECEEYLEGVTLGREDRDDTEFQDQLFAYAQCMRDNGYDMPDPVFAAPGEPGGGGPGGGVFGDIDRDDPAFQEAQSTCEEFLPGQIGLGRGPGVGAAGGGAGDGGAGG